MSQISDLKHRNSLVLELRILARLKHNAVLVVTCCLVLFIVDIALGHHNKIEVALRVLAICGALASGLWAWFLHTKIAEVGRRFNEACLRLTNS
jgi:hypothetical protein